MTVADWLVAVVGAWLAASPFLAVTLGRALRRADTGSGPFVDDEGTRWIPVLPPVPPSRRLFADDPAEFLDGIPAECLSDDMLRPLFDDIVAAFYGRRSA